MVTKNVSCGVKKEPNKSIQEKLNSMLQFIIWKCAILEPLCKQVVGCIRQISDIDRTNMQIRTGLIPRWPLIHFIQDSWFLSLTKDWHRETIFAISVIEAPNRWSCVVQWERFKDGHCHSLVTKESLRYSMIITQCVYCYDPHLLINQYKYIKLLTSSSYAFLFHRFHFFQHT